METWRNGEGWIKEFFAKLSHWTTVEKIQTRQHFSLCSANYLHNILWGPFSTTLSIFPLIRLLSLVFSVCVCVCVQHCAAIYQTLNSYFQAFIRDAENFVRIVVLTVKKRNKRIYISLMQTDIHPLTTPQIENFSKCTARMSVCVCVCVSIRMGLCDCDCDCDSDCDSVCLFV